MKSIRHSILSQLHHIFPLTLSEEQLRDLLSGNGYIMGHGSLRFSISELIKSGQVEKLETISGNYGYRLFPYPDEREGGFHGQ